MADDHITTIKSGHEIVTEFIAALEGQESLDAKTVASIRSLHEKGKLTKTNLVRALEENRSGHL